MDESHAFGQLVQRVAPGSKLLRTWPLKGGVSAQVTAVEIRRPDGQQQKLLVRRHGLRDRQGNPQIATTEFRLLQVLQQTGVAAPAPYYLDQAGEFFNSPGLVLEYVEGAPEFAPANVAAFVEQMAAQLAQIHQVQATGVDLAFLANHGKGFGARPAVLDTTLHEAPLRDRLEALWPLPQTNPAALLHGDFWPGNLLWHDGRLAAVIDWEDAAIGDPLADVGNSRLELLWALGAEAMTDFTEQYRRLTDLDWANLPYWDLCAALRPAGKLHTWGLDAATEKAMKESHRWFVTQAFATLAAQGR
ncbi:MAG: phosphotransferase family protein [Caldilinea sp. CFX5]|nr:phosphotransferase family protein [Caldilinea sp. CFX5]